MQFGPAADCAVAPESDSSEGFRDFIDYNIEAGGARLPQHVRRPAPLHRVMARCRPRSTC